MDAMGTYNAHDVEAVLRFLETPSCDATALMGFDGYIDSLYRVVKGRDELGRPQFYRTIAEYADRIQRAAGISADIELHKSCSRFGGNAPLMADAMARQGAAVTLCGMLGYDEPAFQELAHEVRQYSLGQPFKTIALEFEDGKIMMGDLTDRDRISWSNLIARVGMDALRDAVRDADLICMLNWSAHCGVLDIAAGLESLIHGCAEDARDHRKICFFDLADPSALSGEKLRQYLNQIRSIGTCADTVLGLNENEASAVMRCLMLDCRDCAFEELIVRHGEWIRQVLNLRALCVHSVTCAFGFTSDGCWTIDGFHVDKPLVSTGGGDNFNAGLCLGLINGLEMPQCLLLGNAASAHFVSTGASASREDLSLKLKQRADQTLEEEIS